VLVILGRGEQDGPVLHVAGQVSVVPRERGDDRHGQQVLGLDARPGVLKPVAQPGQHRNQQILPGADAAVADQRRPDGLADPLLSRPARERTGRAAGRSTASQKGPLTERKLRIPDKTTSDHQPH